MNHNSDFQIVLAISLCAILISSGLPLTTAFAATVTLDPIKILTDDKADSDRPDIVAIGNNVTIVFLNGTDVNFINSTDNGVNFPSIAKNLTKTGGDTSSTFPQVAIFDRHIYTVWHNTTFGEIAFSRSNDNGLTHQPPQVLNGTGTTSNEDPDIATSEFGHVYVVWRDDTTVTTENQVFFIRSLNNGTDFEDIISLGDKTGFVPNPKVATAEDNVYVVWQNFTDSSNANIAFAASNNNGTNFDFISPKTIGNADCCNVSQDPALPQIAASGDNVYVSWQNKTDSGIYFASSSDNGSTFTGQQLGTGGGFRISTQIAVSGDNVYVSWQEGIGPTGDIKFRKSTDNGLTFESEINISSNAGDTETRPKMAAFGTNVFVLWEVGGTDILLKSSSQSGASGSFGTSPQTLSDPGTDDAFSTAIAASSGNKVYTAWRDSLGGSNKDIFFRAGTLQGADIQFDKTPYRLGDIANITVTDTGSILGSIEVNITSTTTPKGNAGNYTLPVHPGIPGFFTKLVTLSETSSTTSEILKVSAGDTLNAFFGGNGGQASIFSRTVDLNGGLTSYDWGFIASVRVVDQNSNSDSGVAETVQVTIKTDADPSGDVKLTLTETGLDTGKFGGDTGATKSNLLFMRGNNLIQVEQTMTITLEDSTFDTTGDPDTRSVDVTSTTEPALFSFTLTETGGTTGIFEGTLSLSSTGPSSGTTKHVSAGDFLSISTPNTLTSNAFVIPNPNSQNGAIQVNDPNDTVVAEFKEASASSSVLDGDALGGGGGGGVRVGLVVNALAGVSSLSGGGGTDGSPPITSLGQLVTNKNFEIPSEIEQIIVNQDPLIPLEPIPLGTYDFDFPLSINENGFALGQYSNTIKTTSLKTGEPVSITILFYEQTAVQHVSMYLNLRDVTSGDLAKSDTKILYNKDKPLEIIDPNGYFDKVDVIISEDEDTIKKFATFEIVFAKSMEKSDIVLRAWDDRLRSMDTIILDAIQVFDQESYPVDAPTEVETSTLSATPEPESLQVPEWIKNNAGWWAEGNIEDSTFINGLEFLVQEGIIDVPTTANVSKDPDQKEEEILEPEQVQEIPSWIKNTAQWWSEELISEKEFIQVVEYLIKTGAIKI